MKKSKESIFDDIYAVVSLIPEGKVTSYGAIAAYLGMKSGARVVGWAMNGAVEKGIPAHRVVNRQGLLTGKIHFGTSNEMERLLKEEGITVQNDKIVNLQAHFWDPTEALEM